MNFVSKTLAIAATAGLSLSAMAASANQVVITDAKVSEIRTALAGVKIAEAPYRAAHIVKDSAKIERSAVVQASVEAVLAKHPTAVAATVRAILTVAPDESNAVMRAVLKKTPAAYKTALVVIGEINPSSLASAAQIVASEIPAEAGKATEIASQFASSVQAAADLSALAPLFLNAVSESQVVGGANNPQRMTSCPLVPTGP